MRATQVKNVNLNPNSLAAMATNQGPLRLSLEMPRMEFSTAEQLRMRVMYGLCCGPQCFPAASAGLFTTKLEDIKAGHTSLSSPLSHTSFSTPLSPHLSLTPTSPLLSRLTSVSHPLLHTSLAPPLSLTSFSTPLSPTSLSP